MDAGLVDAGRSGIDVLLNLKGIDLALRPGKQIKEEQPGGGYKYGPGPLRPVQRFAISDITGTGSSNTTGESGVVARTRSLELTGRHDAVAEPGDYWENGETRYRIDELVQSNEYVRKWRVTAIGPEGTNG